MTNPRPGKKGCEMLEEGLTEEIIGYEMKIHRILGPGFLESVYEKALFHQLRKAGVHVECQQAVKVCYDGVVVGEFVVDMLVAETILVENKAVQTVAVAHEVQLVNYLAATGIEIGLLLNFGAA